MLFAWVTIRGIDQPHGSFDVNIVPASLAAVSWIIATVSYFWASERFRTTSALLAYLMMLLAVFVLIYQTNGASSPFLALWMIASIFSGVFGMALLGVLATCIISGFVFLAITSQLDTYITSSLALGGLLPLLMSYVLWHGKSNTDKTKERAYNDLANELNQVANKSEVVINAISDGVIAISNTGLIELINPAAERLVGWVYQDAMSLDYKSVIQLVGKDGRELDKSTDPVFEVLSTNQPKRRDDLQLQTSSGKKVTIDMVISPIGRLGAGAIIVFRDITKERAEEQAQAEFISTASHEMRTPVASIEGYLGLALNPATATIDAKAHDYITKAHAAAEHLGRLFQDLLDVTKADDGRLQNNPKVIDVVSFTAEIIEGLKPKADEKQLRLFFKAAQDEQGSARNLEPIFYVDLDSDHLREVLANLVENAIKYTPKGEVVIDVEGDDEHVIISIHDSGIGIPNEDIPHLFQKFYRVDNTDTREIGGTGLGLYLCRKLVETMGGRIWVESEYKKGSTFSVELPRISHAEAQKLIEASSSDSIQPSIITTSALGDTQPRDDASDEGSGSMSTGERNQALATPIIMSRESSSTAVAPPSPATLPEESVAVAADPVIAATSVPNAQATQVQMKNPMVIPPSWQKTNTAVQPASAPVPVQTRAQTPVPTPVATPVATPIPTATPVTASTAVPAMSQPVPSQGAQKA